MDEFLQVVVSNGVIATALAALAALAARCRVSPAVVHLLWLLVLAKLFTPPVLPVTVLPAGLLWPAPVAASPEPDPVSSAVLSDDVSIAEPMASSESADLLSRSLRLGGLVMEPVTWQQALLAVWLSGCAFMATHHTVRVLRVRRLLKHASPAPEFLVDLARRQSSRLGIRSCPEVVTLPVRLTPAVWSLGARPRILFPADLVRTMPHEQLETLLAHELAHVRRRDHLVRLAELAATTVFWWHPVVWWGRTELREMEEQACDALVLKTVPHGARTYAIALVETLEFLSLQSRPLPIGATAASPTVSLQRRIEMLKQGSSRRLTVAAALVGGALFLPAMTLALAAEPRPTIAFSTKTDDEGKPTVKVVIAGIPPEKLSPERIKTLVEFLDQDSKTARGPRESLILGTDKPGQAKVLIDEFSVREPGKPSLKLRMGAGTVTESRHESEAGQREESSDEGTTKPAGSEATELRVQILQMNKIGTEKIAKAEAERAAAEQRATEQKIARLKRMTVEQIDAERLAVLETEKKLAAARRDQVEAARLELEKMARKLMEQARHLDKGEGNKEIDAAVRDLEEKARQLTERVQELTRGQRPDPAKPGKALPSAGKVDSAQSPVQRVFDVKVWQIIGGERKEPESTSEARNEKEEGDRKPRDPRPRAEIRDVDEVVRDLDALLKKRAADAARDAELERKEIDKSIQFREEEAERKARALERTYDALRKKHLQEAEQGERAKAAELLRREAIEAERATIRSLQQAEEAELWSRAVELLKKADTAKPPESAKPPKKLEEFQIRRKVEALEKSEGT